MTKKDLSLVISLAEAAKIAKEHYNLWGEISHLPGELDFNFKISTPNNKYLLKISRPDTDRSFIDFQSSLLEHMGISSTAPLIPTQLKDINNNLVSEIKDKQGRTRLVRVLSWIEGRLWSEVNPHNYLLLNSLGEQAGLITLALKGFDHPLAHRRLDWDLDQAEWTRNHLELFSKSQKKFIRHFQNQYISIQPEMRQLRKSVVHNDANDNNILVSTQCDAAKVIALIDYGDAVHTSTINDVAIAVTYAIMDKPDPLQAAVEVIKGYHSKFALEEQELTLLYTLIAMRLVVSVTKSALNKTIDPANKYLLVSERPAWALLEQWHSIPPALAHYSFRNACGFNPHPAAMAFCQWAKKQRISAIDLFKKTAFTGVKHVDTSLESKWLGHEQSFIESIQLAHKLADFQKEHIDLLLAGGYLEPRMLYTTEAFKKEGNNGPEYRAVHLGIDFWVPAQTPLYAPLAGKIYSVFNNDIKKDYGPTIILEHKTESGIIFYTLYGHLSKESIHLHKKGDEITPGTLLAYIGHENENGGWAPHLHFQIMLDLLDNKTNFPGAAYPNEIDVWRSISPDPNLLFKAAVLNQSTSPDTDEIISYRKEHLGKSLSLSYQKPLNIVRGSGVFLYDASGRKYLDTVNNVAHVGHENLRVVRAGQEQMALLNTNTRYLHKNITQLAQSLLKTFPDELSIVHFVNSGSEANELALRMAKAYSGQKDMIAVEVGYHGNTAACIDISSYKFDGKGGSGAPEYTQIVPLPDQYRGLYRGSDTGKQYAEHIKLAINAIHDKGRGLAGFICESIISCGGQVELPNNYLRNAYEFVREAGGVCIADEVQVGCGRVGETFWGFQLHQVVPDIVTIGKPLGNGHPVAAVVCTAAVAEAFANGMEYFNTFGGNPVSCAIGNEVLKVIEDDQLQQNALMAGNYLKAGLAELQERFPIIGDVRGKGLFLGFELVDEQKNPLAKQATYLANRMRELGILMSTDGKDNNVMKIKPPMVFSQQNADELVFRLNTVLAEDFMQLR